MPALPHLPLPHPADLHLSVPDVHLPHPSVPGVHFPHLSVPDLHLPHLPSPPVPHPHVAEELRTLARRTEHLAEDVRREGERLRRRAASADWESAAASAFRERAEAHAQRLTYVAALGDAAAEALTAHARVVEAVLDSVGLGALT